MIFADCETAISAVIIIDLLGIYSSFNIVFNPWL